MRTVRLNVTISAEWVASLDGLVMRTNAHEMEVRGIVYPARTLLFRSHTPVSVGPSGHVVEIVMQFMDKDFPEHKRQAFQLADLHLLLEHMGVPNIAVPDEDEDQAALLEDELDAGSETILAGSATIHSTGDTVSLSAEKMNSLYEKKDDDRTNDGNADDQNA